MFAFLLLVLIVGACIAHILLRPNRQPESRVAWLVVVLVVPYLGALAYLLLGQTNVGRKRIQLLKSAFDTLPRAEDAPGWPVNGAETDDSAPYCDLFKVGRSITGNSRSCGNRARLMADSDATITEMVADIDAATDHVHLLFYIWLTDDNGTRIAEALMRAAKRGVTCRAMIDDLGSRVLRRRPLWKAMAAAGVKTNSALRIGNPFLRILVGRLDLRNHRKILVIDNRITYCGSQNCADPAFLPKKRFGPWVDVMMRFEGPVVRQNQHLFASDWMGNGGDDISDLLRQPMPETGPGFCAQVIGTGPTFRNSAMPEMFVSLIYAARKELFITTPYYVPNAPLQAALCASANRGIDVTMILPARNDDFGVAAASRSYYEELLQAGVKIYEFQPGLLHAKTLTMDGEVALIGSANMDRRSFDLNYENNILLYDRAATGDLRLRQGEFLAQSRPVTAGEVAAWGPFKRLWNNSLAIVGPVL